MKLWQSELGIWTLIYTKYVRLHGTTPRNAEVWGLTFDVGPYGIDICSGIHRSVEFWSHGDIRWHKTRNKPDCTCDMCQIHRPRPLADWLEFLEAIKNDTIPKRKLPPRDS